MDWETLDRHIPHVTQRDGERETLVDSGAGWEVWAIQPGIYWQKTRPPGGDYVIRVSSDAAGWAGRHLTAREIFEDVELKTDAAASYTRVRVAIALAEAECCGLDPVDRFPWLERADVPGLEPPALLTASQCLAMCEHRRNWKLEPKGGGRYLPLRFAFGVIFGKWSAAEATLAAMHEHSKGLPGLLRLRARHGNEPSCEEILGSGCEELARLRG